MMFDTSVLIEKYRINYYKPVYLWKELLYEE